MRVRRRDLRAICAIILHIALYALIPIFLGQQVQPLWLLSFGAVLIWCSLYDFWHFIIPDLGVLILVGLGTAWALSIYGSLPLALVLSGLLWAATLWALRSAFRVLRGIETLGIGDIKLIGALGLWLGPLATAHALLIASLSAICFLVIIKIWTLRDVPITEIALPFGSFLCLSAWAIWFIEVI